MIVDDKLRQMTELEMHFHRWTLHELNLPKVIVKYVDMLMRKRLLMGLKMSAEELQEARMNSTGPWQDTQSFVEENFTEDDHDDILGLKEALERLRKCRR